MRVAGRLLLRLGKRGHGGGERCAVARVQCRKARLSLRQHGFEPLGVNRRLVGAVLSTQLAVVDCPLATGNQFQQISAEDSFIELSLHLFATPVRSNLLWSLATGILLTSGLEPHRANSCPAS